MKYQNKQRGFVRFIILLIVVLVIAQLAGYNPIELWNNIVWPVILFGWKVILIVVNLLVDILRKAYTTIIGLVNKN